MAVIKRFFAYSILILCLWTCFAFYVWDKYTVPVLMYHRVTEKSVEGDLNTVSQRSFDWQMKFLRKHGYSVISLEDLVSGINRGVQFNRRSVVVTFDDGFDDNYQIAFPILKKYGFPATVFMISGSVSQPGFLSWKQLMEMNNNKIAIACHTHSHHYLPDIKNKEDLFKEIFLSKKELEDGLGIDIDYFSYPVGGFSEEIKDMVRQAGYKGACVTNRGFDRFNNDPYELKRIRINDTDNALSLWVKLSGYYNLFRSTKKNH